MFEEMMIFLLLTSTCVSPQNSHALSPSHIQLMHQSFHMQLIQPLLLYLHPLFFILTQIWITSPVALLHDIATNWCLHENTNQTRHHTYDCWKDKALLLASGSTLISSHPAIMTAWDIHGTREHPPSATFWHTAATRNAASRQCRRPLHPHMEKEALSRTHYEHRMAAWYRMHLPYSKRGATQTFSRKRLQCLGSQC